MRTFFITDIHGYFDAFMSLLKHVGFNGEADRLIIGGDMIDRGPHSGKVLLQIKKLQEQFPENIIALVGNHEMMMADYFINGNKLWLAHGGLEALKSFEKTFKNDTHADEVLKWAAKLPLLCEDEDFVYTHAGIDPSRTLYHQSSEILWMTDTDFCSYNNEEIFSVTNGKKVVYGHTACEYILDDGSRICCDLGASTFDREIAGLALVQVSQESYARYSLKNKTITDHQFISAR